MVVEWGINAVWDLWPSEKRTTSIVCSVSFPIVHSTFSIVHVEAINLREYNYSQWTS